MKFVKYGYKNKINESDYNQVFDIMSSFYGKSVTKESFDKWLENMSNIKDYYFLLRYKENILVGFINYMYTKEGLMLSEVQVRREYQNKGILILMLNYMISNCDIDKFDYVFGTINKSNLRSQSVFKHLGFKLVKDNLYKISKDDLIKIL